MAHLIQLQMVTLTTDNTTVETLCDIVNLMNMRFVVNDSIDAVDKSGVQLVKEFRKKYPDLLTEVAHD
jgi:hypothetical protein